MISISFFAKSFDPVKQCIKIFKFRFFDSLLIISNVSVSALREWMAELGARKKVAVSSLGKIKTIIQMVALGFLIFEKPFLGLPVYSIGIILIYIAVLLTLISMFQYLVLALPKLKK